MPCTGKFKSSQDIILMQDTDANHKPDAGFPPAKGLEFSRFYLPGSCAFAGLQMPQRGARGYEWGVRVTECPYELRVLRTDYGT